MDHICKTRAETEHFSSTQRQAGNHLQLGLLRQRLPGCPPVGNGCPPVGNRCSPVGNGCSPVGNGCPPVGNGCSPVGNGCSLVHFVLETHKRTPVSECK
uniref:Uncharacterized protein n=1 Tax=Oryzias latipes TaxID=8090 RepID=A0A3P9I7U9_ORYLA